MTDPMRMSNRQILEAVEAGIDPRTRSIGHAGIETLRLHGHITADDPPRLTQAGREVLDALRAEEE